MDDALVGLYSEAGVRPLSSSAYKGWTNPHHAYRYCKGSTVDTVDTDCKGSTVKVVLWIPWTLTAHT
jgi:hypothetical protein